MFCHVTPIRTPCSRLLACRPADLICRIADVAVLHRYASPCIYGRRHNSQHNILIRTEVAQIGIPKRRGLREPRFQ
jgi:hypothetical protein